MNYSELHTRDSDAAAVALVTGGSGVLGGAVCQSLAQVGFDVAIQYRRNAAEAEAAAASIRSSGARAQAFSWDALSAEGPSVLAERVEAKMGAPSVIVHCVTPQIRAVDWKDSLDEFVSYNELYVKPLVGLASACLPEMMHHQDGVIVGMLTEAMLHPSIPGWSAYAAAKAAMAYYLAAMSQELSGSGVRVVGVMPAAVRRQPSGEAPEKDDPTRLAVARRWPIGVTKEAVGDLVGRVATEASEFPNGTVVGLSDTQGLRRWDHIQDSFIGPARSEAPEPTSEPTRGAGPHGEADGTADHLTDSLSRVFRETFDLDSDIEFEGMAIGADPQWDSVKQVELMMEVEAAFQIEFTEADMPSLLSFADIRETVRRRTGE